MTKSYEKLLASCQRWLYASDSLFECRAYVRLSSLSEQLYLPMPTLKTASQKAESIQIGMNTGANLLGGDSEEFGGGGKWEDEEERRFFEEIPDLKDYVPRSVLGLEGDGDEDREDGQEKERKEKERVEEEVRKLEEELAEMKVDEDGRSLPNGKADGEVADDNVDELVFSRLRALTSKVLIILEAFPLRLPGRQRNPRLPPPSWRHKARRNSLRRCLQDFRTLRTGLSLIRLR